MSKGKRILWGIIFLAIAAMIVCQQLGMLEFAILANISIGKLIVTLLLAICCVIEIAKFEPIGTLIFATPIVCMYKDELNLPLSYPIIIVIAIFLAIGLCFIFPESFRKRFRISNIFKTEVRHSAANSQSDVIDSNEENLTLSCSFGSSAKYINSSNVRNIKADVSFGEMSIYFNNANVKTSEINLNVAVSFASLKIFVPSTWVIETNVESVAANVERADGGYREVTDNATLLRIKGSNSFSNISVFHN